MILVTGAAGKTGQAIIRALVRRNQLVRALVHRPEQRWPLHNLGASDVMVGDMRNLSVMDRAVEDVWAVYHICPNMSPEEETMGQVVIAASRTAGVQHLVYHSVLHPQTETMPHHWQKLRVEERLFESGLAFTILQPAAYMQNVLAYWDQIIEKQIYAVPYAVHTRLGMVDLKDVAEAAAVVLTEPGHIGATYELAGPAILNQTEIARILSKQLKRVIRAEAVPRGQWARQARTAGLSEYQIEMLIKMFVYYEQHGFWGNPNVLTWLLGRPPTTFAAFVQRTAEIRGDCVRGD